MKKKNAIEYFKQASKLANALGIHKSSISQWGDIIPEKQAMKLERITNGALKYDPSLYQQAA